MGAPLHITGDPQADDLLTREPLALLIGMLLDQQIPIEVAFTGPLRLQQRIGPLSAASLAGMDPAQLEAVFRAKPALHRYPAAMAKRTQALCAHLVARHAGDPRRLWIDVDDGTTLVRRLRALPGFGPEKAKIFAALLARRFAVQPSGWVDAVAPFADDQLRSVADLAGPGDLERLRAHRQTQKAQGLDKQDRPVRAPDLDEAPRSGHR